MRLRLSGRVASLERTLIRRMFESAPPGAINLGLGEPDLGTPPGVALAGIDAIARGRTRYSPTAGIPELREAIARRYPGFASGPDDVVITAGSQAAMFAAALALLDTHDEWLYPDPGYSAYPTVASLVGARSQPYPLRAERGFRLDARDVLERLTPRTRAVVLCSPSNPTGAVNAAGDLETLVRELERREIAWISDEVYAALAYGAACVSPSRFSSRGLVVSSLSKEVSMTGWRVGWVVGPCEAVKRIAAVHQHLVTCAPTPAQHAAAVAFGAQGDVVRGERLRRFAARRAVMAEELERLPGVRFSLPEGGFYFFVDVSAHGASLPLARRILERAAVITIPGIAFGPGGEGYLRLSFAAPRATLREAVARIGGALGCQSGVAES